MLIRLLENEIIGATMSATYDPKGPLLDIRLTGLGTRTFSGDDAIAAWDALCRHVTPEPDADPEHLLLHELLAAIHGDQGRHTRQHGLVASTGEAFERVRWLKALEMAHEPIPIPADPTALARRIIAAVGAWPSPAGRPDRHEINDMVDVDRGLGAIASKEWMDAHNQAEVEWVAQLIAREAWQYRPARPTVTPGQNPPETPDKTPPVNAHTA